MSKTNNLLLKVALGALLPSIGLTGYIGNQYDQTAAQPAPVEETNTSISTAHITEIISPHALSQQRIGQVYNQSALGDPKVPTGPQALELLFFSSTVLIAAAASNILGLKAINKTMGERPLSNGKSSVAWSHQNTQKLTR